MILTTWPPEHCQVIARLPDLNLTVTVRRSTSLVIRYSDDMYPNTTNVVAHIAYDQSRTHQRLPHTTTDVPAHVIAHVHRRNRVRHVCGYVTGNGDDVSGW